MQRTRAELVPGWRAGLMVLAAYAMFLQAFLGGLAGPGHAARGFDPTVICGVSADKLADASNPAGDGRSAHECVCAALCHAGGFSGGLALFSLEFPKNAERIERLAASHDAAPHTARIAPPARGPPHAVFV